MIAALVVLAVLVVGIVIAVFGWDRYRVGRTGDMSPTDEIFIDPISGRRTRVWYDATTGQRDYRPE
jgi:hypothetical protein